MTLPTKTIACSEGYRPAGWWQESEDGRRLLCGLCPRACSLGPGDRGFCFVRRNIDGKMVSTTYGRSTGFCVDPIEKKPLNQFYPGTAVLSFGTAGCNLGCKFCQNWSMSRSRDVDAACEVASPQTIAEAAVQLGCRSVAFTYNDPIIWAEYAIDTARACREVGIKTVAVTSGYITPAARPAFYEQIDAANVDLKGFTDEFYRKLTGGRLAPVLDTLRWLARQSDVWLEITNLIIPGANDSPDDIERMCRWIVDELGPDVPLHFSAFHPDFEVTDRPPTPPATLIAAYEIAQRVGLRYVYTGNVSDRAHQSTRCPDCDRVVIQRDGYTLGTFDIAGGRCRHCNAPVAGHYDERPGTWGSRRLPIRIADYSTAAEPALQPEPSHRSRSRKTSGDGTSQGFPPELLRVQLQEQSSCHQTEKPPMATDETAQPELTDEQQQRIFQAAGRHVAATVRSQAAQPLEQSVADVAATPLYGAFVSLKRGGRLRSCCGLLGETVPLSEAVARAAVRAAKEDPRFPPISASELEHLDMEVWLLWGPKPVAARGEDRIGAVVIGKHGLQIARGAARGLLLPGVAVDHHLDAEGFLKQVCLKAGLPVDAWKQDDTTLMTFEGHAVRGSLRSTLEDTVMVDGEALLLGGPTSTDLAALAQFCRGNILAMVQGATPAFYMPGGFDGNINGLAITVGQPGTDDEVQCSQISVRPEIPLQATLFKLTEAAARALVARRVSPQVVQAAPLGLTVLLDPAIHGTADAPQLQGVDSRHRVVLVMDAARSAWVLDPQKTADQLLAEAMEEGKFPDPARAQVVSLAAVSTEPRMSIAHIPRPQTGPEIRPAAVAGTFYPGTAEEVQQALDRMFSEDAQPKSWPAVMVPHAGWTYSGSLAAKVFSRVKIPEHVVILCPKHRPGGSEWAVAPHRTWSLPGLEMASDPELARRLAEGISGLQLDATSHRQEHAVEVQLPLIARLAPHAKVVGITMTGGSLAKLLEFGRQMAQVLGEMPERPLLVISSDMNHFADDTETRRLDRLALDAMETLDPTRLYETVSDNRISMCGMTPAVVVMETLRQWDSLHRHESVGYTTSAEASDDTSRVVGYAGMLLG